MPGLLNPEDGSYAAPPPGPSRTQGYLDNRNPPPASDYFPGDTSKYLPSTNRRGSPHPKYEGQVDPPLPGQGTDTKNPQQKGGPGTAPPADGGPPPADTAISSAEYELAGRNAAWIDQYLAESGLGGKAGIGFSMAHAKDLDKMNLLLKRINGRGGTGRVNGLRMINRFLGPKVRRFKETKITHAGQKKEGLLNESASPLKPSDFSRAYKDYIKSLKAKSV